MKRFLPVVLTVVLVSVSFSLAKAQSDVAKYPEGTCIKNDGNGLWQQNADGTWSLPNDPWNRCLNQNVNAGYLNSYPSLNGWQGNGFYSNYPQWQRTNQYPWGTDYPGGYTNYQDYFINCVLAQSLVARPECQGFPRLGSGYGNLGYFGNPLLVLSTKIGNNTIAVAISQKDKVTSALSRGLLGWTLGMFIQ